MKARRSGLRLCGFIALGAILSGPAAFSAESAEVLGKGPAYETVGKLAVMHEGRIKPLDTLAREEGKQIFGRESAIKLFKPAVRLDGKTRTLESLSPDEVEKVFAAPKQPEVFNELVETWGPVGAFVDWSARPEFWDEQPFILVDYLPLRRLILAESTHSRLKAIAEKSETSSEAKAAIAKLIDDPEPSAAALKELLAQIGRAHV